MDFKQAFELYVNSEKSTIDLINKINQIKSEMNRGRTDYKEKNTRVYKITPYWLLGFVEGEGSFFVRNNVYFNLNFSLGQSAVDLALMKEIRIFLIEVLPKKYKVAQEYSKAVSLIEVKSKSKDLISISISTGNQDYIKNVLIPFFDSMLWQSKKQYDYQDWKTILKIKELGLHKTDSGISVIKLIISQMNLRRLSTNPDKISIVDRLVLTRKVEELLDS